jgi:hypothetical protein
VSNPYPSDENGISIHPTKSFWRLLSSLLEALQNQSGVTPYDENARPLKRKYGLLL